MGKERFSDHLRVSPHTLDESWLTGLPEIVRILLDEKNGAMELIVVDRIVTVKGEVPDKTTKQTLLDHLAPAHEVGYTIVDQLQVKE